MTPSQATFHDRRWDAPLIGITGRQLAAHRVFPTEAHGLRGEVVEVRFAAYAEALARGGGLPVFVSRYGSAEAIVSRLDGVVLAGGTDVDPRLYGSLPAQSTFDLDPELDRFELAVIEAAVNLGRPVLGVCRGLQIINVFFGGTLIQDLGGEGASHGFRGYPFFHRAHPVTFAPGSTLHGVYGDAMSVNTLHHQAIDRLGSGLRAVGHADDGLVEAVESVDGPVVGVQWHPEWHREPDPVFEWLVERASGQVPAAAKGAT